MKNGTAQFAFGSAMAVRFAVGAFSYRRFVAPNESIRWAEHAYDILKKVRLMSYSMKTVITDVRDFVLTRKQRTPSESGIHARYQSQTNCRPSKPVELEAFEGLVKSINNFRLTKVGLPEHGAGSCA